MYLRHKYNNQAVLKIIDTVIGLIKICRGIGVEVSLLLGRMLLDEDIIIQF